MPALNKKSVGMFYFLWLGSEERMSGKYNITRLLKECPDELWDTNGTPNSPVNTFHYWNEPLFGYYRSDDKWVIAKHMEMLFLAGVDFLYLDATNALPYPDASRALFEVLNAMYDKGIPAPKAAYYTNSHSIQTAKQVYELFYKNPEYDRVWYRPDGVHPLIIGNFTPESDAAEASSCAPIPISRSPCPRKCAPSSTFAFPSGQMSLIKRTASRGWNGYIPSPCTPSPTAPE